MPFYTDPLQVLAICAPVALLLAGGFMALCQFWGNNENSVYKAFACCLALVACYAGIKSGGITITLGIIWAIGLYILVYKKKFIAPKSLFTGDRWALLAGGLFVCLFILVRFLPQVNTSTGAFSLFYSDDYIYAYLVKGMRDLGAELPYAQLEPLIVLGQHTNTIYHYPDLWATALLSEFLPISSVYIGQFILYPLVLMCIALQGYYTVRARKKGWLLAVVAGAVIVLLPVSPVSDNWLATDWGMLFFEIPTRIKPLSFVGGYKAAVSLLVIYLTLVQVLAKNPPAVLLLCVLGLYVNFALLPAFALALAYISWPWLRWSVLRDGLFFVGSLAPFVLIYKLLQPANTSALQGNKTSFAGEFLIAKSKLGLNSLGSFLGYFKDQLVINLNAMELWYYYPLLLLFSIYAIVGKDLRVKIILGLLALFPVSNLHPLFIKAYLVYALVATGWLLFRFRKHRIVQVGGLALAASYSIWMLNHLVFANVLNAFQLYEVPMPMLLTAVLIVVITQLVSTKTTFLLLAVLAFAAADTPKTLRWEMGFYEVDNNALLTPKTGPIVANMLAEGDRVGFLERLEEKGGHLIYFNAWYNLYDYTDKPTFHPINWGALQPAEQARVDSVGGREFQATSSAYILQQQMGAASSKDKVLAYVKQAKLSFLVADDAYLHQDYPYLLPYLKQTGITNNLRGKAFSLYSIKLRSL